MDDLRKLAGPYVLETERNSFSRIATLERQLAEARQFLIAWVDGWDNVYDSTREWLKANGGEK